jgi:co-chaperonin GroES (HSP10)
MNETTETTTEPMTSETPAKLEGAALVAATWAELGFSIAAVGTRVFLRTENPPKQTAGGIYLPPMLASAYGQRLGSQVLVTGTVLSIGPLAKTELKVGERIAFFRLPFGWTHKLKDDTLVGWIPVEEILGVADPEMVAPYG